jgi:uncharacterized protein
MSTNTLALSIALAWIISQAIKAILDKHTTLRFLFITGGMPSSHSAVMGSLATGIYFLEGWNTLLIVTLALTAIVAQDAFGVRRTVGLEGKILKKLAKKKNITVPHFAQGHTPEQVIIGIAIGSIITIITFLL